MKAAAAALLSQAVRPTPLRAASFARGSLALGATEPHALLVEVEQCMLQGPPCLT